MADAPPQSPVDADRDDEVARAATQTVDDAVAPAGGVDDPAATDVPAPPASRRVRARLARLGAQRSSVNPVLEPLFRIVRSTHPKADLRLMERAYDVAETPPPGPAPQERRPLHHPPARRDHDPRRAGHDAPDPVRGPAARHGGGHGVHARGSPARLRRRDRRPGGRRDQARQGQVRRVRAGRDRAQDGRGDGPRHPGAGHQARRPAPQHAHAALPAPREAGAEGPRDAGDLRAARAPAGHEHHQVGARGPRVRDPLSQGLRRDRAAGHRPRAQP